MRARLFFITVVTVLALCGRPLIAEDGAADDAASLTPAAIGSPNPQSPPASAETKTATLPAPPVIQKSNQAIYPFGESQPELVCAPLRACDVELQAGESVHGVALGDSERWMTSPLFSGETESLVPHVIVKPKDYGLATNLIIATTRRTYRLSLVSPSKAQSEHEGYLRHISFYYPADLVQQWTSPEALKKEAAAHAVSPVAPAAVPPEPADPTRFHYHRCTISSRRHELFTPEMIFDDGERTYMRFSAEMRSGDAPVLFAVDEKDEPAAINYRITPDGLWYVSDGLYPRFRLAAGAGPAQRSIDIHCDNAGR